MINDPTIKRIRRVRQAIARKCGHNPAALIRYYQAFQQRLATTRPRTRQTT